MNRLTSILLVLLCCIADLAAQTDSTSIDSYVTVERDYQPVIQNAGKIELQPQRIEVATTPSTPQYSDFSQPLLDTDFNFNELGYAETNFTYAKPLKGFLRGGFGHVGTQFDFNYMLTERKDIIFNVNANHLAQWGTKTHSSTRLGMDFSKLFENTNLYFGADARNIFFNRYGRYFRYSDMSKGRGAFNLNGYNGVNAYSTMAKEDFSSQWEINTRIGVRSLPGKNVQYKVQTGYEAFVMKHATIEHIINSVAAIDWQSEQHGAGASVAVENHLYQAQLEGYKWAPFNIMTGDTVRCNYHAIKAEPYYEYQGDRFNIHAGVNLDFCIGRQKNKIFLPSPNVNFEVKLTKDWLALYGGAVGDWQTSSVREHFQILRYLHPENEIATHQNRTYVPVDAFLGLKMRPHESLLIDLYAHYRLSKYDVFVVPDSLGYFSLTGSDHDCWKVGGKLYYHYRDVVSIMLDGHYNIRNMKDKQFYSMGLPNGKALDRDPWKITLRIDAKITRKISLYSANYFIGRRYVLAPVVAGNFSSNMADNHVVALRPIIDLNIGAQYNFNRWLSAYFELNNYLHRKHDYVYGYQTQGINYMAGISWTF